MMSIMQTNEPTSATVAKTVINKNKCQNKHVPEHKRCLQTIGFLVDFHGIERNRQAQVQQIVLQQLMKVCGGQYFRSLINWSSCKVFYHTTEHACAVWI